MRPRHITVTLGIQQAENLLKAASRGLDEWEAELDDKDYTTGYSIQHAAARDGYRKIALIVREANKHGRNF